MNDPILRIKAAFCGSPLSFIPKGEVWMGTSFLAAAGLDDTLESHFRMAGILGQDMVSLPVTDHAGVGLPNPGYRYFDVSHLKEAVSRGNFFIAAVVDGPFQSLVNRSGLMEVLRGWAGKKEELIRAYDHETQRVLTLIARCLDAGVPAVVMADDLAMDQGLLISPADIEGLCASFYKDAVFRIHQAGATALFHSCGNIKGLMELMAVCGMDGLAAVQHRVNDLFVLKQHMGARGVILGGIDAELLDPSPPEEVLSGFKQVLTRLVPGGGVILGSSCGLYDGRFLGRIKEIFTLAQSLLEEMSF